MNKLLGGIALAGLLCIASSATAWQPTGTVSAADTPTQSLELSVGSSSACPNYFAGALHLQSPVGGGGGVSADCIVAFLGGNNATDIVLSVDSTSPIISTSHTSYNVGSGYFEYAVPIQASSSSAGTSSGTVTLTAVSSYIPVADFAYTGDSQTFIAGFSASYSIEVWGAQGGGSAGGKGGYSKGNVYLSAGETLYVFVGQLGATNPGGVNLGTAFSFNGGGPAYKGGGSVNGIGRGGGASSVALNDGSWSLPAVLNSRLIVAGGGGASNTNGGFGGGATGGSGSGGHSCLGGAATCPAGGSISAGGHDGTPNGNQSIVNCGSVAKFGFGSGAIGGDRNEASGGGGGWYGGGCATSAAGGGSGWVFTAANLALWQAGNATDSANWLLPASYYLSSASTTAGNASFPSSTGTGNETGHTGDGYARITYLGS